MLKNSLVFKKFSKGKRGGLWHFLGSSEDILDFFEKEDMSSKSMVTLITVNGNRIEISL